MSEHGTPPPSDFIPTLRSSGMRRSPFVDYIRFSDFKRLLGQIAAAVDKGGVKSLSILSAHPKEGRTFFVAATALGFAVLLQKRVLIVNTSLKIEGDSLDIRKIYEDQLKHAPILGAGAAQNSRMIDLISPQITDGEDSGADTVDFLIGNHIRTFQHNYDLILIDTCPLTHSDQRSIDPVVIAGQTDASILVTSERTLNRDSLVNAKAILTQSHVRLLGAIHNSGPKIEEARK